MKKIFRAQSTLEFIMIIILVLAGVMVMGPYVLRSVNAYMRSWELSADQAKNNPTVIIQPWELPDGPPPPPSCATDCEYCTQADCRAPKCMWRIVYSDYGSPTPGECQLIQEKCRMYNPGDCTDFTPPNDCCYEESACSASGCPH
jgi:hypothetical protein